ncbi:MAG TPA: hypothetical protein VKP60_01965 [Magnetospirillaceae bacterium]|nr:hypothetical protein [Magnetospirillaceae bacterium]
MSDEILIEEKRLLPVLSVAGRSYSYVWDHRGLLLPPLAVVFLIEYVVAFGSELAKGTPTASTFLSVLAIAIAGIVGLMTFAVGLHRTILARDVKTGIAFLRVDGHLRSYAWAWFKIFCVAILCAVIGALVAALTLHKVNNLAGIGFSVVAVVIPMLFLLPRFALALPAAALGEGSSLRQAWRLTRGNWLRIIAVLVLAILPFTLLGLLLELPTLAAAAMSKLVPNMAGALDSLKYVLVGFSAALRAISTAVLTVTLSLSYAALARPPADTSEALF